MKLRIIENGKKFVIQRKRWWGEWEVLDAQSQWAFSLITNNDWEFYHNKFDTLQDAENFVEKLQTHGRNAWVAFRPDQAKVVRTYEPDK